MTESIENEVNAITTPEQTTTATTESCTTDDTNTNSNTVVKTIYLIRHAESDENRRTHSLKSVLKAFTRFSVPQLSDVTTSFELMNSQGQYDTDLSETGKEQVESMAKVLQENNFIAKHGIELVAHSPLIRAKETCRGMLQCASPDVKHEFVQRVVETELLSEKAPREWIPGLYYQFERRMAALEQWLHEQPENVIALVGHSQYFKAMLQLPYAFGNADVWKVSFHNTASTDKDSKKTPKWTNVEPIYKCADYYVPSSTVPTKHNDNEIVNNNNNDI